MKNFRNIAVGAAVASAVLVLASCSGSQKTSLSGTVSGAPESDIEVRQLVVNRYEVLDTVRTDEQGKFSYQLKIEKDQPEFIYLFRGDRQIAALLLQSGDKVEVIADTLGNYTVSGSEESVLLQDVNRAYAEFEAKANALLSTYAAYGEGTEEAKAAQQELSKEYVTYYRDRMRYVMSNTHSLTIVPVLFQTVGAGGMQLFSEQTDAILFSNVCDSLETVYPNSVYVKALRTEASRRFSNFELNRRLEQAGAVSYVDIEMPDTKGVRRKLSEVQAKVVLIQFWSSTVALQKMFNIEVLQPVYAKYKDRGFEIYQVAIDTDKASWARVVREQGLDWINVCDGLGQASPVLQSYNVSQSTGSYLLVDGELREAKFSSDAELSRILDQALR